MFGPKVCFKAARAYWGLYVLMAAHSVCGADLPAYLYTETPRYEGAAAERFPAGARLMIAGDAASPRALAPAFAASADAAVSFDGKRVLFSGKQRASDAWQIWEMVLPDGPPRRVTAAPVDCIRPFYLPDDRLVYARRTPQGFQLETVPLAGGEALRITYGPGDHIASDVLADGRILFDAPHASGARDVYTVYVDGSGVETVRCDHGPDRHSARQVESGDMILQAGTQMARFTSARAIQLDLGLPRGEYAGPVAEAAPGEWIVPYRLSPRAPFILHRVRAGHPGLEKLAIAPMRSAVEPVIIRPHAVPKRHPSSLGNRENANILCLNAYTSRSATIPEGTIAAVRAYALGDDSKPVALGQAAVEKDGSFYLQVPCERPIRFELLDKSSSVIQAERGWFWMRRGEQRVCVGCHAGPERAPDNAVPEVLLRTTEPMKLLMPAHTANGGMP